MARYLVTVHRSPNRVQIGARRYDATSYTDALTKGYQAAGQIIHMRKVPKYRCQYMIFNVSRSDGIPVLLHYANYRNPYRRSGEKREEGSWLS